MSSADPRRPEKVQAYKPTVASGGNPNEDLTPDYMNILGPDSTTGDIVKTSTTGKPEASTASNIIPTSPQYGVAIIPNSVISAVATNDVPIEVNTQPVDTITDSLPKTLDENKEVLHTTPSKNDRFKVVKIASSEPFRRGRWKCMDYVDQTPTIAAQVKGASQAQQATGAIYLQTQSLPPQQIQQLLLQGGFTTAPPQFYQNQVVPQTTQFFYQPPQLISGSVPAQFVTAGQSQQYFTTPVVPQSFQNVQFVQPYQSAFVPTTQQYQHQPTYTIAQTTAQSQPQSVVNGFTYTAPVSETKPNVATSESQHSQSKTEPVVPTVDSNTNTQPTDVYTNPQFVPSAHSLQTVETELPVSAPAPTSALVPIHTSALIPIESSEIAINPDDPGKTNPVVNAIDNKIEQAMDLVKSHLMYTVREEVEVLKERIAELMERIQQLETENNYLKSQLSKNISNPNSSTSETQPPSSQAQ